MNSNRTLLATFGLFVLSGSPSYAEDLLQVYHQARQHDAQHLAALARVRADKQKLPQARALLLPEISATARQSRNSDETAVDPDPAAQSGISDYDKSSYVFTLRQPLYDGASFAAFKQAKASVRKALAEQSATDQALISRVAQVYFGLLRSDDNLALAIAEKSATNKQLELARARLQVGLATITEVHEAKARYELTEAQHIEALNNKADAREQLHELTGGKINSISALKSERQLAKIEPPNINDWVSSALEKNLSLLAATADTEIALQEVRVQRAGHLPTLDIVGSRSVSDQDGSSFSVATPDSEVRRENNSLGIELSISLFQGGLTRSLTSEASHRYDASRHQLEQTRRSVTRETRSAFLAVSSGKKKVAALKQAVIASESALQAKIEGFKAGISSNQDVLDAQRDLYLAKRNHADAIYAYILNLFQLKQTSGTLAHEDLMQVNSWLK